MPIFRLELEGEEPSAYLYAGGWTRDGLPRDGWAVIDLTGDKDPRDSKIKAMNSSGKDAFGSVLRISAKCKSGPWLCLPIKDYGVPSWPRSLWDALAVDVARLLMQGTPVMVTCLGGHGRTGMAVCILAGILRPELVGANPIKWLREVYCDEVVETKGQVDYVFEILGLPNDGKTKGANVPTYSGGTYNGGTYNGYTGSKVYTQGDKWDSEKKAWVTPTQPTGSGVGPSKAETDSPKVEAIPCGNVQNRGLTTDDEEKFLSSLTKSRLDALNRLSKMDGGFWEDDDGKIVDINTGEKFTWEEIELFVDLSELEIIEEAEDNLWTEWEGS